MKKIFLLPFTILALSLSACSFDFTLGDDNPPIPDGVTETGFRYTDKNASSYTDETIFDKDNGLEVKAVYSDNSTKVITDYEYVVKNSKGTIIDTSIPFGIENKGQCSVTISYKTFSPKSYFINVAANVAVTGVELTPSTLDLSVGGTSNLTYSVLPSDATNKNVTFTSSNTQVASVDANGKVTAIKEGNAIITCETVDGGFKDTTLVTVTEQDFGKTDIEVIYSDYTNNNVYEIDSAPTSVNPNLLVIPVWFTDSGNYITQAKKTNVLDDINKAYFGTTSETGWHSVKTYYAEESNNQCVIGGKVTDWYNCGKASSTYFTDGNATCTLVESAVSWYFSNNSGDSRKNYDKDGNGYLDGVMLIYAAPDCMAKNNQNHDNMWAYCYWLQNSKNKSTSNPGANVFFWASYDFMYGSNASSRAGSTYNGGITTNCTIDTHTFIHEMGHVFGLDDYYDYSEHGYNPAGVFSMQDYNVGAHDPYSVMALGWANPYVPTTSMSITIGAFQTTHELILLTPSFNKYNSAFDEYLLLELYTPTGLNAFDCSYSYGGIKGPSATGIRLWHVDARLAYYTGYAFSSSLINSPYQNSNYGVITACTNSFDDPDYGSVLGGTYYNYHLLDLIHNSKTLSYHNTTMVSNSSLFGNGSSFSMSTYKSQFYNSGKLNSGKDLGWSFTVSISGSGANATATVQLTKQ